MVNKLSGKEKEFHIYGRDKIWYDPNILTPG